jgi:calcineurin-like phosphoesterase family protein
MWNETVKPTDKVYHLGDVVINRKALNIMRRLNGDKVLIRGNHDIFRDDEYRQHFRELRAYHVMNGMILSHIPVHEASLGRFGVNIHGHTHTNRVLKARGIDAKTGATLYSDEIDVRYHCVCVEQTDFRPILFEDVIKRIEAEGGAVGFKNGNGSRVM